MADDDEVEDGFNSLLSSFRKPTEYKVMRGEKGRKEGRE